MVISGAGMRFPSKESREVGEDVLVEFLLPHPTRRLVRAIARVVRLTGGGGDEGTDLCLAFRTIDAADREAIVRFSHAIQRIQLQSRSAASEGQR